MTSSPVERESQNTASIYCLLSIHDWSKFKHISKHVEIVHNIIWSAIRIPFSILPPLSILSREVDKGSDDKNASSSTKKKVLIIVISLMLPLQCFAGSWGSEI